MGADVGKVAYGILMLVGILVRLGLGVGLFSHKLSAKPRFWAKVAGIVAIVFFGYAVMAAVYLHLGTVSDTFGYTVSFLTFSLALPAMVVALLWLYDTSLWTALFCATAGYTIQNLATGATELVTAVTAEAGICTTGWLFYLANNAVCIAVTYVACYLLFSRRLEQQGLESMENHQMLAMMPVVSIAIIGFDIMVKSMGDWHIALPYVVVLRLFHGFLCVALLWVEYQMLYRTHLEQEQLTAERLLAEHDRQLRLSRENVEAINIKCHDLRHQIRTLAAGGAAVDSAALSDIARDIAIYDSSVKTGNEALDTILTEKRLLCEGRHITLTCIADGAALDFMAAADIYALFGNALDNAIEAVGALSDPRRRSISLTVRRVMGCASIHVENFFDGQVDFADGELPQTTKGDTSRHGFGMRSMHQTAQRYGGTFSAQAKDGTFCLDVMLPLA